MPNVNKTRLRNGNARVIIVDEVSVSLVNEKCNHLASCFYCLLALLMLNGLFVGEHAGCRYAGYDK